MPSCGTLCKYLEFATDKKAEIVGKPHSFMIDIIIESNELDRKECIMIGDTMDSDILVGHNAGIDSLLVLTGVSKREEVQNYEYQPNYIYESLSSVFGF